PVVELEHELDAGAVELTAELLVDVVEEPGEVDLAYQDAALATGELEHLALHRAEVIELLEDEAGVVGALDRIGGGGHELHVPADHRERRAHVVHHAGEEATDGGETLAALALQPGAEEPHRGGCVGRDQAEQRAIVLGEPSRLAGVVQRDGADGLVALALERYRNHG